MRPVVKQADDTAAKARARLRSTCAANWIYPLEPSEEYGLGSGPTRVYCDIHYSGSERKHGNDVMSEDSGSNRGASTQGSY